MKFLAAIFLCIVVGSWALPRAPLIVPGGWHRIINGEEATEGQFPYQISLVYFGQHICGGSILSPTVIVTAAHCVEFDVADHFQIVAGELDRSISSGHEQTRQASVIVVHEDYHYPVPYANDIALIFLDAGNPLVFNDFVKPIALPAKNQQTTEDIIVSGWGITSQGGLPNVLNWVQLPVVDDATCADNYIFETILPSMLCAGFTDGGKDSCQGDSGGPLVAVNGKYLAGIVSWGYGCALPNYPGVNTEVSYFVDWINANIV